MSHQDPDCRTPSRTNAQDLRAAIHGLLGDCQWEGIRFRRDCRWAVSGLVTAALVWAFSSERTLTARFSQALKFARQLGRSVAPATTSYQAFLKLLVRWTADLRLAIALEYRGVMEREFPAAFRIAGFVPPGRRWQQAAVGTDALQRGALLAGQDTSPEGQETPHDQAATVVAPGAGQAGAGQEGGFAADGVDPVAPPDAAAALGLAAGQL
jgi:hypothetical protein